MQIDSAFAGRKGSLSVTAVSGQRVKLTYNMSVLSKHPKRFEAILNAHSHGCDHQDALISHLNAKIGLSQSYLCSVKRAMFTAVMRRNLDDGASL